MQSIYGPRIQTRTRDQGICPQEVRRQFPTLLVSILFYIHRKIEVNGPATSEIYRYLRLSSKELRVSATEAKEVPWNFGKFLLNSEGQVVKFFNPDQKPKEMLASIQELLKL